MTIKLGVAVGVASLILGVAGVAVMAQDGQDRAADVPKDFVVQSLGTSAGSTDVWSVQCPIGTGKVVADVNDNGGVDGIRMNVAIVNPQGRATSRTSPDNGVSPLAVLLTASGNYLVLISKTAASAFVEPYDSIIHCQTSTGAAIAHNVVLVQNQ